jgi:hypothetical protein
MFKIVFILVAGLSVFTSHASAEFLYSYTCESVGSESIFNDTLLLEIFEDNFVAVTIEALPYYADGDASPVTIKKKEFMSVNFKSSKNSAEYQLDIEPLIMETALFDGGYPLKKGGKGGFVKFVGQGFSYANFICVLN